MDFHKKGYINTQQDKIRIFIHGKCAQIYNHAVAEPQLSPIDNEDLKAGANRADGSRADIRINGFFKDIQNTFAYIKALNIKSPTYAQETPKYGLEKGEKEKDRKYKNRVKKIENRCFTQSSVLCRSSAEAPQARTLLTMLITELTEKRKR